VNPLADLRARGLLYQQTHDELDRVLGERRVTLYAGFDPTADSLHIGSLIPLLGLARFQRAGHRPIALMGGGTGMIGDPSGRSSERTLLSREDLAANVAGIRPQLQRFLDFEDRDCGALLLDNADWLATYPLISFLRDIGKHFAVGVMLGKDSVRSRMEAGISYTEFSYMLLQSADFLHLYDHYGCTLQIGGQDQWGNITAGGELIRRMRGAGAYGATFPLVTTASGAKFGKSEGGNYWLDPARTSPYELYQYFVNTDDRDVVRYLQWFTFLDANEIGEYAGLVEREPERREAQRRLAREITTLVHGDAEARAAENASAVLFGSEITGLTDHELERIFREVPRAEFSRAALGEGLELVDCLMTAGLASSRGDARRLLTSGAIYLNNRRVEDAAHRLTASDLASSSMAVLRKGKRNYVLLRFIG